MPLYNLQARRGINELINASVRKKTPILFLINDYENIDAVFNNLQADFSDKLYIFMTTGEELKDMINKNDYSEAK